MSSRADARDLTLEAFSSQDVRRNQSACVRSFDFVQDDKIIDGVMHDVLKWNEKK